MFSSVAIRCKDERQCEETRFYRNKTEPAFQASARILAAENSDIVDVDVDSDGQTFCRNLLLMSRILRKSTRIGDRNLVASQDTKWNISM